MPSTPLAINRPDPLVPHFRDRRISTFTVTPPVSLTDYDALPTSSDVLGLYFTYVQSNTGVSAESIGFGVVSDGIIRTGGNAAAASGTLYYVYLDEDADVLDDNVNRLGMKLDFPWYAHSMRCYVYHIGIVPAGSSLTGSVRYEQL